jgi:hypothetical protein
MQRLERLQVNVDLAFVVGGAAAEKVAVADCWFEGGRSPEVEGLGGLNVVMTVKKDGRLAGDLQRFSVDERMETRRNDFNRIKSSGAELVGDPAGGALDVGLVFALGADAGNTQKFAQFAKMLVAATFDKFSKVRIGSQGNESFPILNTFW